MLIQFCSFRSNDFANVWLFFQFLVLFAYSGQWMFEKVPVLNFCCLAKNDTTLLKHLEQTHWNSYDYAVSICSSFLKHFQDKFGRMLSAVLIELKMAWNQFWVSIPLFCFHKTLFFFWYLFRMRVSYRNIYECKLYQSMRWVEFKIWIKVCRQQSCMHLGHSMSYYTMSE